jgi:predicted metal-dependent peptidase
MKAKIPSVKIQKLPPEGPTTGGTGTSTPGNVDVWPEDVDDNNVPERDDEGNIEGTDGSFKRYDQPPTDPGYNPGEVLRPGELGDVGDGGNIDPDKIAEEWEDIARVATMGGSANVPASIRRALKKIKESVIDWKAELDKFIDEAISKSKYTLPARRFLGSGKAQYGYKRYKEDFQTIVIAIDTSGSIIDPILKQFISETIKISEIYKPEETIIIYCSDNIDNIDVVPRGEQPDLNKIASTGGNYEGFHPPFKWVQDNLLDKGKKPSVFIYFTDGYADFPPADYYDVESYVDRCIWVLLSFNNEPFPKPIPFGERIDIVLANKTVKRI